jgi:NADPH:quinone reductase-like Zn-dependent oxidoreductase
MKAIIATEAGSADVLKMTEVAIPSPNENEVLIKIHSAGINPVDYKIRQHGFGREFPMSIGCDVSGVIEAVGKNVTKFKVGDEVFAALAFEKMDGYAEYVVTDESLPALKPTIISHNEAAAVPLAALTAWQAIFDHGQLQAGQKILIHAAAGGVGHFAVQFAKWKGAYVYGTASPSNKDFLESIGVDRVIDYQTEDFTKIATDVNIVFDTVGTDYAINGSLESLKQDGRFITIVNVPLPESDMVQKKNIFTHGFLFNPNGEQLSEIAELLQQGIVKPEIAKVFPWSHVGEAHDLLEKGHTRGKIVLTIS